MGWRPSLWFSTRGPHVREGLPSEQWTAEAATMSGTATDSICPINGQLKQPPAGHAQSPVTAVQKLGRSLPTASALPASRRHRGCPAGSAAMIRPYQLGWVLLGVAEEILLELHFLRLAVLVDTTSWLRNPVSGRDRLN